MRLQLRWSDLHFQIKALFTWRKDDPITRIVLAGAVFRLPFCWKRALKTETLRKYQSFIPIGSFLAPQGGVREHWGTWSTNYWEQGNKRKIKLETWGQKHDDKLRTLLWATSKGSGLALYHRMQLFLRKLVTA